MGLAKQRSVPIQSHPLPAEVQTVPDRANAEQVLDEGFEHISLPTLQPISAASLSVVARLSGKLGMGISWLQMKVCIMLNSRAISPAGVLFRNAASMRSWVL